MYSETKSSEEPNLFHIQANSPENTFPAVELLRINACFSHKLPLQVKASWPAETLTLPVLPWFLKLLPTQTH